MEWVTSNRHMTAEHRLARAVQTLQTDVQMSLNLPGPLEPVQACNGIALPLLSSRRPMSYTQANVYFTPSTYRPLLPSLIIGLFSFPPSFLYVFFQYLFGVQDIESKHSWVT